MPHPEPPRNQSESQGSDPSGAPWEAILERVREATAPRYEVQRLIGYGGMAGVYLAEEPKLGRKVAIKVMAPALMVDPSLVGRFRQEARTIAGLNHPNIITIYDVAEGEDLHYFVMAYLPGRTVGHVMRETREPLPFDVVRAWLYQIGSALDYAHGFGVIHRDVKPGNLLLDDRGNALVTDFGIAKAADLHGFTRTGMLVGTPSYMSPEQCSSGEVGPPSDQYSLGAVAYQLLTGAPPFSGPTLQVLQAHVSQAPRPIQALRSDTPSELAESVERMLMKDPRERWASLGQAVEAMGAGPVAQNAPVRASLAELALPVETVTVSSEREIHRPPVPSEDVSAGETFVLDAVITGRDGRVLKNRVVRWTSENPGAARVFPDGRVVALAPGAARIQARCGAASDAVVFQVVGDAADVATAPARQIPAGARVNLVEILPPGTPLASGPDSGWGSTDPEVVRISHAGEVEALRPGSATLAAYSGGRAVLAELTVTPIPGMAGHPHAGGTPAPGGFPTPAGTPTPGGGRPPPGTPTPFGTPAPGGHPGAPTPSPTPHPALTPAGSSPLPAAPGTEAEPPWYRRPVAMGGGALLLVAALAGIAIFTLGGDPGPAASDPGEVAGPPPLDPAPGAPDPDAAPPGVPDTTTEVDEDPTPPVVTDPEPEPPPVQPTPTPPTPTTGVVRLVALPPGARVSVTAGGQVHTGGPGDSLRLPPGTHQATAEAPGHEPYQGQITVTAGQSVAWSPELAPEPDPEPPPPPPEPEPDQPEIPPGAEAQVRETLTAFAQAFETREMARILQFFPQAPGDWADQWRALIEDRQNARELQASVGRMDTPVFQGPDQATVGFTIQLRFRDIRNTIQTPVLPFQGVLARTQDGWVFRELRERP